MSIVWTVDDHPDGRFRELKWVAALKDIQIQEAAAGALEVRWRNERAVSLSRQEADDLAALLQRYAQTGSIC